MLKQQQQKSTQNNKHEMFQMETHSVVAVFNVLSTTVEQGQNCCLADRE